MQRIAGPGMTLPEAQTLYPPNLTPLGVAFNSGENNQALAPGQSITIPAGDWFYDLGKYSILQFQDPGFYPAISQTAGVWRNIRTQRGSGQIHSDGVNFRIVNALGCAVSAIVTNKGGDVTKYVQASTTVTPSTGNSTWYPIIGGNLSALSCSAVGAGYGVAPLVFVGGPPGNAPGVPATAVATISGGAVNGFTITNAGAGYPSAPTVTILPSPYDPNAASITAATARFKTVGAGTLAAVLCTNYGAPVATSMTLTIAGVGTSGAVSPAFLQTITKLSITTAGSGTFTGAVLLTQGGAPTSDTFSNNDPFIPRQGQFNLTVTAGSGVAAGTVIDGGMYLSTPTAAFALYGGTTAVASPAITLKMGSANDVIVLQPI